MYSTILLSIVGGFIPAIIWLLFWLKEDSLHPEPKKLIAEAFLAGIAIVPIAFVFQQFISIVFIEGTTIESAVVSTPVIAFIVVLLWVIVEELLKFSASYITGIRSKEDNEPIDAVMYLITAALGFAAAENALFIFNPITEGNFLKTLMTGNLRFIGATLLHIASSGTLGLFLAFSFYKHGEAKRHIVTLGVVVAIVLHLIFNLFIIFNIQLLGINSTFYAFVFVWTIIVLIILMLEKVKHIANKK